MRVGSVAALSLLLGACGDASPPGVCADEHALPGGVPCDVRLRECQQRVFEAVRCVRGGEGELPELRVIDVETYAQEVLEDVSDDGGTSPAPDVWSRSLWLLDLLPEGADAKQARAEDRIEGIAAFYSWRYRDVTIVDRGAPMDDDEAVAVLAHELTHALQASESGSAELYERSSSNDDTLLALQTLVEGEARVVEDMAYAALFDVPIDALYLDDEYSTDLRWTQDVTLRSAAPYAGVHWMTYGLGALYVWEVWNREGPAAVAALWEQPPLTTVRWMAGPSAQADTTDRWEEPFLCDPILAPPDYTWTHDDALGALLLHVVLEVHDGEPLRTGALAWDLALGWRGDRYNVYADDDGHVAVSWQLRMKDGPAAERVAEAMERVSAPHEVQVTGAEVTLRVAEVAEVFDAWEASCHLPPREE